MTEQQRPAAWVPAFVRLVDPLVHGLLRLGVPMGPNTLITVRGRRSGEPRSAAVALVEIGDRRWVVSAYGETQWVRNLRAAGEGMIRVGGRDEPVDAMELTQAQAVEFFRDVLEPYVHAFPLPVRLVGRIFTRDIFADPVGTAARRPVFELRRASGAS
jgi:deazaflavin-dependent oxidoreductase (nitroreductase family)